MNLKEAFLKGVTPFLLSWISLISAIAYMALQRFSNNCDSNPGFIGNAFFFSIGIVGLAGAVNKSGFENAAHFIERIVKAFNPFEDGIVDKFIKSTPAMICTTFIVIIFILAVALRPESLKAVTVCGQNMITNIKDASSLVNTK